MSDTKHWNETSTSDVGVIRCPFSGCNTRIITRDDTLNESIQIVKNSPSMLQSTSIQEEKDNDNHTCFFKINDVWDFDNIGVSRPAADLNHPKFGGEDDASSEFKIERLLICSECDRGPLGFAGFFNGENDVQKLSYYLSCSSVVYST
ncbi:uncharacterized protein KQ657_004905 [Scheffersomyces spartinae]|uniref:Mss4-like protein n=1 Tax=Scheffersomyces spartinae TaxID=45513 RepID=A0A9P7VAG5_9ASCO|nr:uncharacterized protein KQ657_004905 [Scheffersomyces spartinae]KAG7194195.1 hypothetical protein KQ657_004905 [Scheffersomyces spartinae]